jgi:hypothetical protein
VTFRVTAGAERACSTREFGIIGACNFEYRTRTWFPRQPRLLIDKAGTFLPENEELGSFLITAPSSGFVVLVTTYGLHDTPAVSSNLGGLEHRFARIRAVEIESFS